MDLARFVPFAREHVDRLVGLWMDVRRDDGSGVELPQHRDPAGVGILVQHEQFNARIRTGLPAGERRFDGDGEHGLVKVLQTGPGGNLRLARRCDLPGDSRP